MSKVRGGWVPWRATVFHLAAQAIVGVANRNPMATFETNIKAPD